MGVRDGSNYGTINIKGDESYTGEITSFSYKMRIYMLTEIENFGLKFD